VTLELTVVMATYKQRKYLATAIRSIQSQLMSNEVRMVLVGVSGDGGWQSGVFHLPEIPFVGQFIFMATPDLWKQRQSGLDLVQTPYVSFFDSDDVMLPGWLDRGLKVAEEISSRGKIPIVGPSYRMVDEKLRPIYWTKQTKEYFEMSGPDIILPEFSMDRMMNGCIIPDFSITTTEALRSVGGLFDPDGYDPGHPYYCYSMWLRLLKKYGSQVEVKLLPDIGFLYRQHRKGSHNRFQSKRHSAENVRRAREVARHYFPELGDG